MKKITPQTEQKLMRVLEKVAEYTADGTHPNDAIIKAGANVLRPGEVDLVGPHLVPIEHSPCAWALRASPSSVSSCLFLSVSEEWITHRNKR